MAHFIDRRPNPKDKNLGNRQRFMQRARGQIKEVVSRSVRERRISDPAGGETISIPTKGIGEPRLRHADAGGRRSRVLSGNREFESGDRIKKPPQGGGAGSGGDPANQGGGQDDFQFTLTGEEFLDIFFEDLELPDLVKTNLREITAFTRRRAGFTNVGNPANLDVLRTMRNSFARRISLKRPEEADVERLRREIIDLERDLLPGGAAAARLRELHDELEALERRRRWVPYIDPLDIRYRDFQRHPEPNTRAVMFCLMDVSGSMGEREKDLAKRFFMLLHLFLQRRYERIEVVFIRHTHEAQEVDEETFFYSRETGGTVVSSALNEMLRVVRERYPADQWNIYAAQASDGDNYPGDGAACVALLERHLMPLCQYYAYVEILDEREIDVFRNAAHGAALWNAYAAVEEKFGNFDMKRIARPGDIYPVFRELFAREKT
ncbi:MAG: YeaH/YhbH family protein [Alphaproteobacteria bacterium]